MSVGRAGRAMDWRLVSSVDGIVIVSIQSAEHPTWQHSVGIITNSPPSLFSTKGWKMIEIVIFLCSNIELKVLTSQNLLSCWCQLSETKDQAKDWCWEVNPVRLSHDFVTDLFGLIISGLVSAKERESLDVLESEEVLLQCRWVNLRPSISEINFAFYMRKKPRLKISELRKRYYFLFLSTIDDLSRFPFYVFC